MKKIELLSPAGNMDSLVAAIEAGCDAVYLGGVLFGARAFAGNFSNDELIKAINYAHLYGVKVYVTTNILVYEHEVDNFLKYIEFLHQNNVDAIIIQDLGMLDLVHQTFPNLEIHASTQMHIHNLDGVIMAKKLGVKRVVLARETPIEIIEEIKKNIDIDLEIFAHGALCVSYSGQCLFSSLIGNRSGNRGSCVGSCRLPYDIVDFNNQKLNNGNYPLSMKDLNTLEYVGKLIESNVTSLKIEGRMKSPEYVYTVTKLYRMAIDSYYLNEKVEIDYNELNNLKKIFNREFTKGYLFNENMNQIINDKRPNHMGIIIGKTVEYKNNFVKVLLSDNLSINDGIRIILNDDDYGLILNEFYIDKKLVKKASKGDVIRFKVNKTIPNNSKVLLTKDSNLVKSINSTISSHLRRVEIEGKVIAKKAQCLKISLFDGKNNVEVSGNIIASAINNATTKEVLYDKLNKINDTVYSFRNIEFDIDDNIFISMKEFNELRREAIELLNEKRLYKYEFIKKNYFRDVNDYSKTKLKSVLINDEDIKGYDIVYSKNQDSKNIIALGNVNLKYNIDENKEYLVGEIGAFNQIKNPHCDYSFNVTNSYTVALLDNLGAKSIALSYELTPKQVENIVDAYHNRYHKHPNLEMIIHGYRKVMTLKTNLNKIYNNILYLKDKFNNKYPIINENNMSCIYDYQLFDDKYDYYNIGINILRDNLEVEREK